jgi:hypothetical protein
MARTVPYAHGPHSPITEPPAEPDETPGPVDPDSNEPDDSIESPEPPRQPGKPRATFRVPERPRAVSM